MRPGLYGPCGSPALLCPPLASSAVSWPLLAFPEPAALAPPLASLAVAVPDELFPSLAVSAVPVPPPFGVGTRACDAEDAAEADPFCPAWLLPSLAAVEIAAPFSTPINSVVVASSEMSLPLPAVACSSADLPRAAGWSSACSSGPGTEIPILASISEATSWAAPGSAPAEASPALQASPAATKAAVSRGRERANGMKDLLGEDESV